jgi:hypothetical protein
VVEEDTDQWHSKDDDDDLDACDTVVVDNRRTVHVVGHHVMVDQTCDFATCLLLPVVVALLTWVHRLLACYEEVEEEGQVQAGY